jgi:glutamyl-tRNA synthetase
LKPHADAALAGNLGALAQPLRVALCGSTVSPPIFDTLSILGRTSSLARIDRCLAQSAAVA